MSIACAQHACAVPVTCASWWQFFAVSLRVAHLIFSMSSAASAIMCETPPSTSSSGACSSTRSGTACSSGSSGFEQDLWVALRSGTALQNFQAQLESNDFAAGRPAGRNLESEMALASVGEPDASPADALPLMPLAADEFEEDAGVLDPARCCLAHPVWAGRNSPNP